jgi:hypothetical protein
MKIKDGLTVCENGDKLWFKNGKLHREDDLPAAEYSNGRKEWWVDGDLIKMEINGVMRDRYKVDRMLEEMEKEEKTK